MNDSYSILLRLPKKHDDNNMLSQKEQFLKRFIDLLGASFGIIVFSPIMVLAALITKFTSNGPVFYLQERIGINGRSFKIIKFRSMVKNAETNGPQLSSIKDQRVTTWGKVMRRWRIDELPQLLNILSGEMSIVGPRPERSYYVSQLMNAHPEYRKLLNVKPGLTSLGMIKFGYAENIDQMVMRMKYDLCYVNSISLSNDLKIILLSLGLIVSGKGR
ncbi:MAG: hypothetical protein NVSMB45_13450 [Ginsengibacter sp.]